MAGLNKIQRALAPPKSNTTFSEGHKSKGILDDHAVRKSVDTTEGTITHTPTNDNDISNKKYVDDENTTQDTAIALNTAHSTDNTQAHSDYLLNTGDTASGDYNFDSNTLLINAATNRVGFGESAPDVPLHVKGLHVSGEGLLKIEGTTSHAYFTVEGAATKNSGLFFKTAGANNFLLDNIYGSYLRFYNYGLGGNNMLMYGTTGRISMGNPASINPHAQLKVSQVKTDANACEVLHLHQASVDEAFLKLKTTSSTSLSRALVKASDYAVDGELKGWAKVYVDDLNIAGMTDGNYYLPLFDDAGDTMTLPNVVTTSSMVLPVKTTTGDQGSPVEGQIYVNTFDNKVRCYADGVWRDLATW